MEELDKAQAGPGPATINDDNTVSQAMFEPNGKSIAGLS